MVAFRNTCLAFLASLLLLLAFAPAAYADDTLNSYAFFKSMGEDAGDAIAIFDESAYSSSTNAGNAYDATDFYFVRLSLDRIDECNALRAKHGLNPLKVSPALMALAERNANYSAATKSYAEGNYETNQNVSYSASTWSAWEDTPYEYWYTSQKKVFESALESGTYEYLGTTYTLTSEDIAKIKTALVDVGNGYYYVRGEAASEDELDFCDLYYSYTNLWRAASCYLNMITDYLPCTGYGCTLFQEWSFQEFGCDDSAFNLGTLYTVEEFRSLLSKYEQEYIDSLEKVSVPQAATGLVYNGQEQTGVPSGTGYTLSGVAKTANAGSYTTTATLEKGYAWSDGTLSDKTIEWTIGKAGLTAAYVDETISYGSAPALSVKVTGFVGGETAATASGYTAPTVSAPSALKAGKSYLLTPSGGEADNYEFSYVPGTLTVKPASTQDMYRLYNPNSGEHFYTASAEERDMLDGIGWNYEGIGWTAPKSSGTPVYRLYNPNVSPATGSGEHHYTTSAAERDMLVNAGWSYEGVGWYSDDAKSVPLYRLYNPNEYNNNHHYTTSTAERDYLLSIGWNDEDIAWYGVK